LLFTGDQTKVIKDPLNDRGVGKTRVKREKGETERKDTERIKSSGPKPCGRAQVVRCAIRV
jgi:hypothetical protein